MDFLLGDPRRTTILRVLIAILFCIISIPSILVAILALLHALPCPGPKFCPPEFAEYYGDILLRALATPADHTLAQYVTIAIAFLPAVLAAVCYEIRIVRKKPQPTRKLNPWGSRLLLVLLAGAAATILLTLVYAINDRAIFDLTGSEAVTDTTRAMFAGILSFQLVYSLKLLGLPN